MKRIVLDTREPVAWSARAAARMRSIATAFRASPWASGAARAAAIALGLLVLGWIGRAATVSASSDAADGGAIAPVAMVSAAPAAAVAATSPPVGAIAEPAAAASIEDAAAPRARASPADPVFLNRAGETDLRRLPGVGAKRAQAILALRQRLGRFTRVEDLLRVKGVGRTTLKKWRPLVRLEADVPDAGSAGG